MLRQLLSTTNGVVGSGNVSSSDYEHYSTYPLTSRNFENSTVILATPFLSPTSLPPPQPPLPPSSSSSLSSSSSSSSSLQLSLRPLQPSTSTSTSASTSSSSSLSSSLSLSLPVPLSSISSSSSSSSSTSTSTILPVLTETVSTITSENQFKIDDDKNLATLEYMSLTAGYGMQTPITSNHLGILDTNNDLNGTTELFSSTYAMLSADSSLSWNVWDEQTRFSNCPNDFGANEVPISTNNHNFAYPVHTTTPGCSNNIRYQLRNTGIIDNNYAMNCQGLINSNRLELQQSIVSSNNNNNNNNNDMGSRNYCQQEKCTQNLNQMVQCRFPDSNQRLAHASIPTGFGETINKCDNKQIICMACRGVYSSRRSLTGHIGRNEKCREIIGRNYLDQMGGFVESMRIYDPGNIINSTNGIDPVCPYCDRFISHYKGNIRRHINQCMKSSRNGNKLRRKDPTLKHFTSNASNQFGDRCNESMTFSDIYQPNVLETSMVEKTVWMDNCSSSSTSNCNSNVTEQQHSTTKTKSYTMKKDRSNDDPFRCPLCDFATIYKGNMKRHLSTCHGLQDDDLKDGCIDKLKYKEVIDSRLENVSRSKRSKNLQYLKVTPKLAQADIDNGPSSSITDCNAPNISQLSTDVTPSTFRIVSSLNNCDEELSLSVINSSDGSDGIEAKSEESSSEMAETLLNDDNDNANNNNNGQIMRLNTIDETIEAVIANGNDNCLNGMGINNHSTSII